MHDLAFVFAGFAVGLIVGLTGVGGGSLMTPLLVLLFIEDWRMGLSMFIVLPLGILCFMSMFSGYNEKFQRTVTATKTLNDTAVEYISGIEVIKAATSSRDRIGVCISILLNTQEPRL